MLRQSFEHRLYIGVFRITLSEGNAGTAGANYRERCEQSKGADTSFHTDYSPCKFVVMAGSELNPRTRSRTRELCRGDEPRTSRKHAGVRQEARPEDTNCSETRRRRCHEGVNTL